MIASYLLDAGERNHNLDELASRYLNHTTTKIEALIGSGKNQKRMDEVPVAEITHYAAEDADVALRLVPLLGGAAEGSRSWNRCSTISKCRWSKCWWNWNSTAFESTRARLAELSEQYGQRHGGLGT